jgi:hypothetical protein
MVKILILTQSKDAHARLVTEAVKMKGAYPIKWFTNEYIIDQKSNLYFHSNGYTSSSICTSHSNINLSDIDVVWFRRPEYPRVLKDLHQEDKQFVNTENRMNLNTLWQLISESATWVNPFHSYEKSNCKGYQLRIASKLGMLIPETLISNDKDSIVDFININNDKGIIYKTFSPPYWQEDDDVYCFHTSVLSENCLPEQNILRTTPGIYQTRIAKKFEVRVTFFGDYYLAVKIHNSTELDWRPHSILKNIPLSITTIPIEIEQQCLAMMKQIDIVFGCFDFIVTPSGDYIFLEVNEMGQFLWLEERLPELKFLDTFSEFLISCSKNRKDKNKSVTVSLKEIKNSLTYKEILNKDKERQTFIDEKLEI